MKPQTDPIEIEQARQRQKALAKVYAYIFSLEDACVNHEESIGDDNSPKLNQEADKKSTSAESQDD